jgi:asparagine synthase (glutamine-hydrolysing)
MCGIFFFISGGVITIHDSKDLSAAADKIKHRGPDSTRRIHYTRSFACFHRLQIVDPHPEGMQPFERGLVGTSTDNASTDNASTDNASTSIETKNTQWMCMVNGEIYNYCELRKFIVPDYTPRSHSDCEVVIGLFLTELSKGKSDYDALCTVLSMLDGEYAIVLYNITRNYAIAVTDELRTRPLFIGYEFPSGRKPGGYYIVSEQKAVISGSRCWPLHPGTIYIIDPSSWAVVTTYPIATDKLSKEISGCGVTALRPPKYWWEMSPEARLTASQLTMDAAAERLRELLIANVHIKMHSDRNYGFLLSGGIDSSLICGIAARYCRDNGLPRIRTFTVGFSTQAPDTLAARTVAYACDSIHSEIIVPYEAGLNIIQDVIRFNESWDQTTVRASIPMSIAARWIKKHHPDIAVIYSGEVADELLRGYLYNRTAVSEEDARADMRMRLEDISMFDGLRADRVIASQGMEVRFPFFSRRLLEFVWSLPWKFLDPSSNNGVEKMLLRKAFDGRGYIPQKIIWRTKNAFSDATSVMCVTSKESGGDSAVANTDIMAVSSPIKSGSEWKEMLKAYADLHVSKDRFENRDIIYPGAKIHTSEDMYYMDIFTSFGYNPAAIPYKWLPSWVEGATDSSATMLKVFTAN